MYTLCIPFALNRTHERAVRLNVINNRFSLLIYELIFQCYVLVLVGFIRFIVGLIFVFVCWRYLVTMLFRLIQFLIENQII